MTTSPDRPPMDERTRQRLLAEIEAWYQEELISEDQRELLRRRCSSTPALPEEVARRRDERFSGTMIALLSLGGGLVILGACFLVGTVWEELGIGGRIAVTWAGAAVFLGGAIYLVTRTRYRRSAVALSVVGGVLLWLAVCAALAPLVSPDVHPHPDLDDAMEHYGGTIAIVLALAYLTLTVITRSAVTGMLLSAALIWCTGEACFDLMDLDGQEAVIFWICAGAALLPLGYLAERSPARFLTVPVGLCGLLLVLGGSFVGTLERGDYYIASYLLLLLVPVAASLAGALLQRRLILYTGVLAELVGLIRLFADVFEDVTWVFAASIVLGLGVIGGSIAWERRRTP